MGSLPSIFARTRETTWNHNKKSKGKYRYGSTFTCMLKEHQCYGEWLDVETEYELKLDKSTLHWKLLVKKEGSQTLPYFSLEITTSNMTNILRTTCTDEVCKDNAIDMGVFIGRLSTLCDSADKIASKMDTYNFLTRNCQTFCNELLKELGKDESPTTFSPDTTEENYDRTIGKDFDFLYKVLPEAKREESATIINSDSTAKASAVKCSEKPVMQRPTLRKDTPKPCRVPANCLEIVVPTDIQCTVISSKPSGQNLPALLRILAPLEGKWEEVGRKLALLSHTLNRNPGMRNMLEKYFEEPSRSWDQLANVVAQYNKVAAQAIIQLAREQVERGNEIATVESTRM